MTAHGRTSFALASPTASTSSGDLAPRCGRAPPICSRSSTDPAPERTDLGHQWAGWNPDAATEPGSHTGPTATLLVEERYTKCALSELTDAVAGAQCQPAGVPAIRPTPQQAPRRESGTPLMTRLDAGALA